MSSLNQSNINLYKDKLIKEIIESKIFDKVFFIDGNFLDYTKFEISNAMKPNIFICLSDGTFEQINNNYNVGLYANISMNFVIVAPNRSQKQNIDYNSVKDSQSSPVFLTSMYELVKILYNSEDLKNISSGDISFENFGYAYDANTAKNNLNLMTVTAKQKILFLSNKNN